MRFGHFEAMERLGVEERLRAEERPALCVDRQLDHVGARPDPEHCRARRIRACSRPAAHPPGLPARDLGLPGGLQAQSGHDADRVEEEPVRGRRRPVFLGALARDGAPVGVPRDPAVAVPHEVALASLHTRRVLAKARLALERELVVELVSSGAGSSPPIDCETAEAGAVALCS